MPLMDRSLPESFLAFGKGMPEIFAIAMLACGDAIQAGEGAIAFRTIGRSKWSSRELLARHLTRAEVRGIATLQANEASDPTTAIELERQEGFEAAPHRADPTPMHVKRQLWAV